MILFDTINNKITTVNKFDIYFKRNVKYDKLRILTKSEFLKNKDSYKNYDSYLDDFKKKFSNDENFLPLYDISTNRVYFIHKINVYHYIKNHNFRPINEQLLSFIEENFKDLSVLKMINLFDFKILENNLLKFIFYNTKEIGSDISFLINPAFVSFLDINPFLRKSSIINTAQNLGIIESNEIEKYKEDSKIKELYNKIKYIFFSKEELISHIRHISNNKMSKVINFYTMYGAFFLNNYIREPTKHSYDKNIVGQINKLTRLIKSAPKLNSDKIIFRFIKNVPSNLKKIDIGEHYVDNSFVSCTRKPHVEAINENFGFILLKINLPKNFPGCCLSIESDSVFPNEKEVILAPGSKFKLISINENVDFYSFNKITVENIKKKYELQFVGFEDVSIPKYKEIRIPEVNFVQDEIIGDGLEEKITYFWDNYGKYGRKFFLIFPDGTKKELYCNYYNSTDTYQKFFYYKISEGFFFYGYNENNEIDIFIEIGDEIIVNFPSKDMAIKSHKDTEMIISLIAYGFKVNKINLFPDYIRVSDLSPKGDFAFNSRIYVNEILFKLIHGKKIINFHLDKLYAVNSFLKEKVLIDTNIDFNLHKYLPDLNWCQLFKNIIKDSPIDVKYFLQSIPNRIRHLHYNFYPYQFLLNNRAIDIIPNISSRYEYKELLKSPEFFSIHMNNFRTLVK